MNTEAQNIHSETIKTIVHPETPTKKQDEGGLLTINGTLVVIIASFIIFVFLMQKIFYGPITEIRRKRSDYIKKRKAEADEASFEAEKLNQGYQENLKEARKKASEKTMELLNDANNEKNKILEEKTQIISEYLNEQKQIIQNDKNQAIETLKMQVIDYAYNISSKILGEEVSMAGLSPEIVDKALKL